MVEPLIASFTSPTFTVPAHWVTRLPYTWPTTAVVPYADVEAIFVDWTGDSAGGRAGDLYLLTKTLASYSDKTRLYKYSVEAQEEVRKMGGVHTVVEVAGGVSSNGNGADTALFNHGNGDSQWTRADMSVMGDVIVTGDYSATYLWPRKPTQTVAQAFSNRCSVTLKANVEASSKSQAQQYESVTLSTDGSSIYEVSECAGDKNKCTSIPLIAVKFREPRPSCYNGVKDGDEEDTDCGGSTCPIFKQQCVSNPGRFKLVPSTIEAEDFDGYWDATVANSDPSSMHRPGENVDIGHDATTMRTYVTNIEAYEYLEYFLRPSSVEKVKYKAQLTYSATTVDTSVEIAVDGVPIGELFLPRTSPKCCASSGQDVYNPNLCPTTEKPLSCCSGETALLSGGKWLCPAATTTDPPPPLSPVWAVAPFLVTMNAAIRLQLRFHTSNAVEIDKLVILDPAQPSGCGTKPLRLWDDVKMQCGVCSALVDEFDTTYSGTCEKYCDFMNLQCVRAWENVGDGCVLNESRRQSCEASFTPTGSSAVCECEDRKAPTTPTSSTVNDGGDAASQIADTPLSGHDIIMYSVIGGVSGLVIMLGIVVFLVKRVVMMRQKLPPPHNIEKQPAQGVLELRQQRKADSLAAKTEVRHNVL